MKVGNYRYAVPDRSGHPHPAVMDRSKVLKVIVDITEIEKFFKIRNIIFVVFKYFFVNFCDFFSLKYNGTVFLKLIRFLTVPKRSLKV